MDIKPLNSNNFNQSNSQKMNDRLSRLKNVSDQFINNINDGIITEEDMMKYDPEMSGMTQFGSSGIVHGSNVSENINPIPYSQLPQNGYDNYQRPIYYQPSQSNYAYSGYYSQTTPSTNLYSPGNPPYYSQILPQYQASGLLYQNPYGLDPRNFGSDEDMVTEYNRLEEERKKVCNTNVALAMYFRDLSEVAGSEFSETRDEYEAQIRAQYGFKTYAQIRLEQEEENNKLKEQRLSEMKEREKNSGLEVKVVACIVDENGNQRILTKGVNEKGEISRYYSRREIEMDVYNAAHFYDAYNKQLAYAANFQRAINNRVKIFRDKYDSYSWEDLVGPKAKMCDYYDEVVTKQDSNKLKAELLKNRWDNGSSYINNFWHSNISTEINFNNMSKAFRSDYELAKQIHAANLARTPDEIEISTVLNNSLQRDYDMKRAIFIDKVSKGESRANMAASANQREVVAAPDIYALTEEEAGSYLDELEKQERLKTQREALQRNDNIDPITGGHIISQTEINNPGYIPGTNIPILKRTIVNGVMSDEEALLDKALGNSITAYYDTNGNLLNTERDWSDK